ncbi:MAG: nucleotide sugar dehydrogenase [Armatimonadetes bacterium]|nr:nucleotide sugar dehydrogenase [Armatimonadota bacterium]
MTPLPGEPPAGLSAQARSLAQRIDTREAVVAVVGLGYVGLPLAVELAHAGYRVIGYDIDGAKVEQIQAGVSYLLDVPAERVARAVAGGRLQATSDPGTLGQADVAIICVPTPFTRNREPDTTFIERAAREIAATLHPGHLTILRSTSYPGTTEELVRPYLQASGFGIGQGVFLAFAPERMEPGNLRFPLRRVPVVVGGCEPAGTYLAGLLLAQVSETVHAVSTPAAAEMTKLLENVFRNVNIALVNQLAMLCERMGLDIWEIVEAAATKPYGFMSFSPGLVGGHCIPVDPYYLAWKAREYDFHMDFIELAARVNEEMPYYVATRALMAINERKEHARPTRIFVVGITFKKDVPDFRHSAALKVMEILLRQHVEVAYHDPFVPEVQVNGRVFTSQPLTEDVVGAQDCVIIATDHSSIPYQWLAGHARLVFDVRNALKHTPKGDNVITL